MLQKFLSFAVLALAATVAMAQAAKPFIGTWTAEWETDKHEYGAEVVINETGGSWKTSLSRANNPCAGREVPLQFDNNTERSLSMTLKFSDVIPGCKNVRVKLELDADGKVVGKRSDYELKLTRKSN